MLKKFLCLVLISFISISLFGCSKDFTDEKFVSEWNLNSNFVIEDSDDLLFGITLVVNKDIESLKMNDIKYKYHGNELESDTNVAVSKIYKLKDVDSSYIKVVLFAEYDEHTKYYLLELFEINNTFSTQYLFFDDFDETFTKIDYLTYYNSLIE